MPTSELIENFAQFARAQVLQRGDNLPIDELFDEWRILNPPSDDWPAVRASLRDMESGETGQPFEDFADEFRRRNDIRETI
jgi:hypothetical protein